MMIALFNRRNDRNKQDVSINEAIELLNVSSDLTHHQITINGAGGVVELFVMARLGDSFEPLLLSGEPYIHDLSTGIKTIHLDGSGIKAIKGVPSDLTGEVWGLAISSK